MTLLETNFQYKSKLYLNNLNKVFTDKIHLKIEELAKDLLNIWQENKQVFICGNGGSAANAIHIANDFHYGTGACGEGSKIPGLKVDALPANQGILTCLANDTGYENIFSQQLEVKANPGDLLLVLSGSGNSKNILKALEKGSSMGLKTHAILAYDGGKCKLIADSVIHFQIDDMQIAEDTQLIISHICMQWLNANKPIK